MPTSVESTHMLELDDRPPIELRPLKIKRLREFMTAFEGLQSVADSNDKSLEVLLQCAAIAMKQYAPDIATVEQLENILDLPNIYLIIEAASGMKLGGEPGNFMAGTTDQGGMN